MYFPFLYGRRSELLALRAMLKDHRPLDAFVPVVEPVIRKPSDLSAALKAYGKAGRKLALIINPDKHDLKVASEAAAWRAEVLEVLGAVPSIVPTMRCSSSTTAPEVNAFLKQFKGRAVAIAYASPSLTDAQVTTLAGNADVHFHLVLNGKMSAAQQALLPSKKRVDIRDYFNRLERNADYAGEELFTDRHRTFEPKWLGFGDYAAIGSAFTPGGGPPAAVAIHAVFKHKSGDIWIEHFVSDDTDAAVGSVEGKFLQAANKLVVAAKARPKSFGHNFALDEYAQHVATGHFPGLGKNKELQLTHHFCLMLDVLSGAV